MDSSPQKTLLVSWKAQLARVFIFKADYLVFSGAMVLVAFCSRRLSLLPVVSRAPPAGSLPPRLPSREAATILTILPASADQLRGQGAGGVSALPSAEQGARPASRQTACPAAKGNCEAREEPGSGQEPCGISRSVPNSQWALTPGLHGHCS